MADAGANSVDALEASADPGGASARVASGVWWILGLSVAAVSAAAIQLLSDQPQQGYFLLTLTFLVCGAGALVDAATRRIPNALTYPAILIGLGLNSLLPLVASQAGWETPVIWAGSSGWQDGASFGSSCS